MSDYIDQLAGEGQYHSSGHFSLDPAQAMRKIRGWLLQPEDCFLYLLQSAVASGATYLNVETHNGEAIVTHDGFFPEPNEVPDILSWTFRSQAQPVQHRLGLALAASLTLPGQGMVFEKGYQTLRWSCGEETPRLTPEKLAAPSKSGRIRVPLNQPWWKRFFGLSNTPALKRLCQRGRFAPLKLQVGGNVISGDDLGMLPYGTSWFIWSDKTVKSEGEDGPIYNSDHHTIELRIASQSPTYLNLDSDSLASHFLQSGDGQQQCDCAVMLRYSRRPSKIELVQHGVSLSPFSLPNVQPECWVLLADEQVVTDPTCLVPVQNERLLERVQAAVEAFQRASESVRQVAVARKEPLELALVKTGRFGSPMEAWQFQRNRRMREMRRSR